MKRNLEMYLEGIKPACKEAAAAARERADSLIKPPGSLGRLEDYAVKLAGITGSIKNGPLKKCVLIMCSDNGVVDEGVAAAPQEITLAMAANFVKGTTGAAVLAKHFGADIRVFDVGINSDVKLPGVTDRKIKKSTGNIALGPAMSRAEAEQAILAGIEAAESAKNDGYQILGAGEMGIGNTTTTTAILSALTGLPARSITGAGAGLTPSAHEKKILTVDAAVKINAANASDPVDLTAKLGGFDIAAMTGVYIGAAHCGLPVVADGYISAAAAYLAVMFNEKIKDYLFLSHVSEEPGYLHYMRLLGMEAPLCLNMRLGEGSGCPLMFAVIDAACAALNNMATFGEALAGSGEEYLNNISGAE
ncbi:MAG: nicotinate-nucleotide--dimethylbenzimidazole phosphoribosyltransferase [Defluviitaleaceae bacterium]|nr:nicotinate-nucleotide--dimethylbenzimidazole phosphoribosyltransferase [Defluviitaleaceae bacterium]